MKLGPSHTAFRAPRKSLDGDGRYLKWDRIALRRALGGSVQIEAELVPKATGHLAVNAARMWRFFTTSVYQSGDLPVLATREALQNSVDATRAAIRARQIGAKEGRFAVGMDAETVLKKFLSLGDSGKMDAENSDHAAGGFGVAKAVILGLGLVVT